MEWLIGGAFLLLLVGLTSKKEDSITTKNVEVTSLLDGSKYKWVFYSSFLLPTPDPPPESVGEGSFLVTLRSPWHEDLFPKAGTAVVKSTSDNFEYFEIVEVRAKINPFDPKVGDKVRIEGYKIPK